MNISLIVLFNMDADTSRHIYLFGYIYIIIFRIVLFVSYLLVRTVLSLEEGPSRT